MAMHHPELNSGPIINLEVVLKENGEEKSSPLAKLGPEHFIIQFAWKERWPEEIDLYREYFHRIVWNNMGGLVTRTLEEVVGRCIFWDVRTYMAYVYARER